MERTAVLELMAQLKLYGLRAGYDEIMATGIKPRHQPPRIGRGFLRHIGSKGGNEAFHPITELGLTPTRSAWRTTTSSKRGQVPR